jgi:hypothetical protein
MTHRILFRVASAALMTGLLAACSDTPATAPDVDAARVNRNAAPPPAGLETVEFGGASLTLWPYTTDDFATGKDPVNLLFMGRADPREIRAALLALDGDRSALGVPFDCTWTDALDGGIQAAYADGAGWMGSSIQLACGAYSSLRFHVRLFRAGDWTVGAAHMEVLIPGTTEHQVLSWEMAEQFVALDMYRTGLGGPVGAVPLGPVPSHRVIPAYLYNLFPSELQGLACPSGVPWPCDGSADVPIYTNGQATVIGLGAAVAPPTGSFSRTSTIQFDQVIPKPFCTGGAYQVVYVNGPIVFREHWVVTPSNNFIAHFVAEGTLYLTPIDPGTGQPVAGTYAAQVYEEHRQMITDRQNMVSSFQMQMELPPDAPFHGTLQVDFSVGPNGTTASSVSLVCGG